MKILVTGAAGQLGTELRKTAGLYTKHNFIFANRRNLDITDFVSLQKFFNSNKIDLIINTAAYTDVDRAESELELARKINVEGPRNLAIISDTVGSKLIHISTNYVFDGTKSCPYDEQDITNPLSVYGRTKRDGENAVLSSAKGAVIIRVSQLYSRWVNLCRSKNFVKTILNIAEEKKELKVVCDQAAAPTYAGDLARDIIHIGNCLNSQYSDKPITSEIYHYSNGGSASWYDFAKAIVEFSGKRCRVIPIETKDYPLPAARPKNGILSLDKIKKHFNIVIPEWRDSLKVCLRFIRENEV